MSIFIKASRKINQSHNNTHPNKGIISQPFHPEINIQEVPGHKIDVADIRVFGVYGRIVDSDEMKNRVIRIRNQSLEVKSYLSVGEVHVNFIEVHTL